MKGLRKRGYLHLSLFEKVILVNSVMLVGEALMGMWITSHNLEAHHYLIDTSFIVFSTLATIFINSMLLRISFRPLFSLLTTIRAISAGDTEARARTTTGDTEIAELAQAFNTMLDRLNTLRREQTSLILQAQEDERRRLALELHDETGQNLTALLVHTEILQQTLLFLPEVSLTSSARQQLHGGLQQLATLTQNTLENVRVLAQQLRPSVLDDLGLPAALRWLVEDSQQRLQLCVKLSIEGIQDTVHALPPAYETALFRIAQESLTNIARHAQIKQASITLQQKQAQLYLRIRDEGHGYDIASTSQGMGVFGMRERAVQLGGQLTITSHPGQGTTIEAVLPLPATHSTLSEPIKEVSYAR